MLTRIGFYPIIYKWNKFLTEIGIAYRLCRFMYTSCMLYPFWKYHKCNTSACGSQDSDGFFPLAPVSSYQVQSIKDSLSRAKESLSSPTLWWGQAHLQRDLHCCLWKSKSQSKHKPLANIFKQNLTYLNEVCSWLGFGKHHLYFTCGYRREIINE